MTPLQRSLLPVLTCLLLSVHTPAAFATEAPPEIGPTPPTAFTNGRPELPSRGIRDGRNTALAGFALISTGGLAAIPLLALSDYNFRGEWYDKAAYDAAYNARQHVILPVGLIAASLGGLSIPLIITGTLVEMEALKRHGMMRNTVGWVGFSLFIFSATLATFTPFFGYAGVVVAVASGSVGAIGFGMILGQFGRNVRASRRLSHPRFREMYGPTKRRAKVTVTVAPLTLKKGGGLALVGRF
jgi:hypothetical protein